MTPLRQRMIDDMQARNLSPATQKNYIHYVYELAKYFMALRGIVWVKMPIFYPSAMPPNAS